MKLAELYLVEYIRKISPKEWRVYSEKGRNMGTFNSLKGAKNRLGEVHYFKSR